MLWIPKLSQENYMFYFDKTKICVNLFLQNKDLIILKLTYTS